MSARSVAVAHARARARLAERMRRQARAVWARVDRAAISESWASLLPRLLFALIGAQRDAASSADLYLAASLTAQGVPTPAASLVVPGAFAGIASDGRDLASLLAMPAIVAKSAIGQGHGIDRAMATGGALAQLLAHTQVTDAGRTADGVALAARPHATGYVRMVSAGACSRCLILAGRHYEWNAGFKRHPHCSCTHIPAAEDSADDLRTDPRKAFDAMSAAEQDKTFTKAGAQAIRDGADMAKVVNARRGMQTASMFGREVLTTTEAAGRRVRLMPEQIYRDASSREDANRLLRRFGYIR